MSMRAFLGMKIFYQIPLLLAIYIFMDAPYSYANHICNNVGKFPIYDNGTIV